MKWKVKNCEYSRFFQSKEKIFSFSWTKEQQIFSFNEIIAIHGLYRQEWARIMQSQSLSKVCWRERKRMENAVVMRLVKPFFEVDNIDPMDNIALPGFNSLFSLPQAFGYIHCSLWVFIDRLEQSTLVKSSLPMSVWSTSRMWRWRTWLFRYFGWSRLHSSIHVV